MVEQLRINILVNSVIGIEKFTLCREKIPFCPTQSGHGTSTLPFTSSLVSTRAMLWFISVVFILFLGQSLAIFEHQVGEYDYLQENLGRIQKSLVSKGGNIIVATEKNLLASVDAATADIKWRIVLSRSTNLVNFVLGATNIYTLAADTSHDIVLVSAWAGIDGTLLWERQLPSQSRNYDSNNIEDMLLDADTNGNLSILYLNSFIILSAKTGDIVSNIDGFDVNDKNNNLRKSGFKTVFSSIVPTVFESNSLQNRIYTAIGCTIKVESSSNMCVKSFAFYVNVLSNTTNVVLLPSINVHVNSLRGIIDFVNAYIGDEIVWGSNDFLYGLSSSGMTVLPLENAKANAALDLGKFNLTMSSSSVLKTVQGKFVPLVTTCNEDACKSTVLMFDFKTKKENVELIMLLACSGSGYYGIESDCTPLSSSILSSVHCVRTDMTSGNDNAKLSLKSASIDANQNNLIVLREFNAVLVNIVLTSLHYTSISVPNKLLVVDETGFVVLVGNDGKVLWHRNEELANIKQVVLTNSVHHLGHTSTQGLTEHDEAVMMLRNFNSRMLLQLDEIYDMGQLFGESLLELPNVLSGFYDLVYDKVVSSITSFSSALGLGSTKKPYSQVFQENITKRRNVVKDLAVKRMKKTPIKSKRFGFDKISFFLSTVIDESSITTDGNIVSDRMMTFNSMLIRVTIFDVAKGITIETLIPTIPGTDGESLISFVKLVKTVNVESSATLVVSTCAGTTYIWDIKAENSVTTNQFTLVRLLPSSTITLPDQPVTSLFITSSKRETMEDVNGLNSHMLNYLMIHKPKVAGTEVIISLYPILFEDFQINEDYIHLIDKVEGMLTSYRIVTNADSIHLGLPVANVMFNSNYEKIISVTYPNNEDVIDKRYTTLRDDSILLKYLNPHSVLIITATNGVSDISEESKSILNVYYIDTISGKIIYRTSHEFGSSPVHSVVVENICIYSYWNTHAKRSELSTIVLYEGMVDKFGLNPFSNAKGSHMIQQLQKDSQFSAFNSVPPLCVQKTFIMPRLITSLQHTTSAHGTSNKNVLVGFNSGQVYAVDMRSIHPRRPLGEPTLHEKEEGLMMYNPYVILFPTQSLTYDYTLENGISNIYCVASKLESTSLVLSIGYIDLHFNRVMPSQGFDSLSSDFNHSLVITILLGIVVAVFYLRKLSKKKQLDDLWN